MNLTINIKFRHHFVALFKSLSDVHHSTEHCVVSPALVAPSTFFLLLQ